MTEYREHSDDAAHDRWIDRQLRRIPLPPGLLRRLRRIARRSAVDELADNRWSDERIDAALRNVAIPEGFLDRLPQVADASGTGASSKDRTAPPLQRPPRQRVSGTKIASLSDDQLDAVLCDIPLPVGLTDRLAAALGDAAAADERQSVLGGTLQDVPIPSGMLERLSQIPTEEAAARLAEASASPFTDSPVASDHRPAPATSTTHHDSPLSDQSVANRHRRRRGPAAWQWASGMALSLALLFSVVYLGTHYLENQIAEGPISSSERIANTPVDDRSASSHSPPLVPHDSPSAPVAPKDTPAIESVVVEDNSVENNTNTQRTPKEDPWNNFEDLVTAVLPPGSEFPRDEFQGAGSPLAIDPHEKHAALAIVNRSTNRGVRPPWADANALTAQLRSGFHPFVAPADHEEFRTRRLPWHFSRDSYDWAAAVISKQGIDSNELGNWRSLLAKRVRTEDFLNGLNYNYPRPTNSALALRAYGGTSPFGRGPEGQGKTEDQEPLRLLQLGIQAAAKKQPKDDSDQHLIIVVDTSSSMAHDNRLNQTKQALHRLIDSLGARDRMTIVTTTAKSLAGTSAPFHGALIHNAGRDETVQLHRAVDLLRTTASQDIAGAVLITERVANDRVADDEEQDHRRTAVAWLSDGTSETQPSWQEKVFDALQTLTVEDSESLFWNLRESLTGHSEVVAHDAEVEISFDPDTVTAYRLLGHEADSIVDSDEKLLRVKVHATQAMTVLFELQFKPTGNDSVATVKLSWRDAATDQTHEQIQRISRWQFAPTFEESAVPLQAATVAAATAESLRQSVHLSPTKRSIDVVRRLADEVHPQVADNISFQPLMHLLLSAEKAGL